MEPVESLRRLEEIWRRLWETLLLHLLLQLKGRLQGWPGKPPPPLSGSVGACAPDTGESLTKSMLEQNSNSNLPHGILSLSTDETGLSAMETPLGAVQTPMRARRPEKQKLLSKSKNLLQKSRKPHSNGAQNNDLKYGERLQNMQNLESENVNPSRGMRGGG